MRSDKLKLEEVQAKIDSSFTVIIYNGYGKKSKFRHNICNNSII